MKVFIVFAHPEPKSFNGAMFRTACKTFQRIGSEIKSSDLYAMKFDSVSDRRNFKTVKDPDYYKQQAEEMHATKAGGFVEEIEEEMRKLEWCDLMLWQFPLWWLGLPAILKGWVDRGFAMGRIYGIGRMYEAGVFHGKHAIVSLTTGAAEEAYKKGGFNGDIHAILRPIQRGMLQFVGFDVLAPNIVYAPPRMSDEVRQEHLNAFAWRLEHIQEESPVNIGTY